MSYNPAKAVGPGNWPPVSELTTLNPQERAVYSSDQIFSNRVHAIQTSVPILRNPNASSFVRWTTTMTEFNRLYPNQSGAHCMRARSFSSRVCHRQKRMRDLIAMDKALRRLIGEESGEESGREKMDGSDGRGSDDEGKVMAGVEVAEADKGSEVSR